MFRNISKENGWVKPYDHDPFVLDTNGTLLTNRLLDFEVDEQNQTIQIIASTGSRQSLPQEFTVSITNVVEDLDGDGLEDFHDSDSDGDGLSNLQEFSWSFGSVEFQFQ